MQVFFEKNPYFFATFFGEILPKIKRKLPGEKRTFLRAVLGFKLQNYFRLFSYCWIIFLTI